MRAKERRGSLPKLRAQILFKGVNSEHNLRAKLNVSRIVRLSGKHSEPGNSNHPVVIVRAAEGIADIKFRSVESIGEIGVEFKPYPFGYLGVLPDGKVLVKV